MEHRPLGRTGVSVSKLCLGAMMFGDWGTKDHDQSIRIIHRALDAGINFIDTADAYSAGESEEILGKALAGGRRDEVVLATKVWFPMGEDANRRGGSRRWIIGEVEDSLRRLGTDWIDLYQIHRYEPDIDLEETLGALTDLVHQGKVRYIGSSTFPASAIVAAQWTARDRHLQRFVCEQPPYSILVRGIEAAARQPAQARGGRGARPAGRGGRAVADRAGHRVRAQPSGGHRGDHRAPDHGAAGEPAPRRRRRLGPCAAGPHRRDRSARHQPQPRRRRLGQPGPAASRTTALKGHATR
jgi:aryl-alcohol dehydrogenase-like predicted oxidoreductase